MHYFDKLNWRYATKIFDPNKTISKEDLEKLKQGIRMSASSFGLEPYKILVVKNPVIQEELQKVSWNQPQITSASHLLIFAADYTLSEDSIDEFITRTAQTRNIPEEPLEDYRNLMKGSLASMDKETKESWITNQVYIALGFGLITAAQLGIDSCPMEGFDKAAYDKILNLNEKGLYAKAILAVGYRSSEDKYQHLTKVRKDTDDLFLEV